MLLIVSGSRSITDMNLVYPVLERYLQKHPEIKFIGHGNASGVDTLAGQYATDHGYQEVKFPANWRGHGKKAGHIRNKCMALLCKECCFLAIWDGESKGTKDMFELVSDHYELVIKPWKHIKLVYREEDVHADQDAGGSEGEAQEPDGSGS